MIDPSRRTVIASGAAAAAASAVPQVFAQAQPAGAVPGLPDGAKVGFYEKGNVRIRYAEIGAGFPLLALPGGGLNSRIEVWARAVINIPQEFKNDFTEQTFQACGGKRATMSPAFSKERIMPIYPSPNLQNLNSSSTSKPPRRSALRCLRRCLPPQTR